MLYEIKSYNEQEPEIIHSQGCRGSASLLVVGRLLCEFFGENMNKYMFTPGDRPISPNPNLVSLTKA